MSREAASRHPVIIALTNKKIPQNQRSPIDTGHADAANLYSAVIASSC